MQPVDEGIVAVALYEYEAAEEGELSAFSPQLGLPCPESVRDEVSKRLTDCLPSPQGFVEGQRITNIDKLGDEGWWQGKTEDGVEGVFPSNYVEEQ
jgi:hypothetical protein